MAEGVGEWVMSFCNKGREESEFHKMLNRETGPEKYWDVGG